MQDKLVNIESDMGSILAAKADYHKSQIVFHQEQLKNIQAYLQVQQPNVSAKPASSQEVEVYGKTWYWNKNAYSLIREHFRSVDFRTSDLVDKVMNGSASDKVLRGKAIYAASMALSKLSKENKIVATKKDGVKGYDYTLL